MLALFVNPVGRYPTRGLDLLGCLVAGVISCGPGENEGRSFMDWLLLFVAVARPWMIAMWEEALCRGADYSMLGPLW